MPVAFGVKKLVLSCVVEDDKVKKRYLRFGSAHSPTKYGSVDFLQVERDRQDMCGITQRKYNRCCR